MVYVASALAITKTNENIIFQNILLSFVWQFCFITNTIEKYFIHECTKNSATNTNINIRVKIIDIMLSNLSKLNDTTILHK